MRTGGQQLGDANWLRCIIVTAGDQAALAVFGHGVSGEGDDGNFHPLFPQLARQRQTIHHGHLQIGKD